MPTNPDSEIYNMASIADAMGSLPNDQFEALLRRLLHDAVYHSLSRVERLAYLRRLMQEVAPCSGES